MKQWPLKLGNTLSLSDTACVVPGHVICAFATTYKPAVVKVYVPCIPLDPCWEHKL